MQKKAGKKTKRTSGEGKTRPGNERRVLKAASGGLKSKLPRVTGKPQVAILVDSPKKRKGDRSVAPVVSFNPSKD